jgi:5-formyltetrahydrofolate cyclo-ligase
MDLSAEQQHALRAQKQQLREKMLTARAALPERTRNLASRSIAESFMGNIPRKKWDVIAGYIPIRCEVETQLLLEALSEEKHTIALPCVVNAGMPLIFRRWQKGDTLVEHPRYKILEPAETAPIVTPSIILVPLVAFDAACFRLGYGGGFYDRTLEGFAHKNTVLTCGIAYAKQQIGFIPRGEHDQPLDCVITENRLFLNELS